MYTFFLICAVVGTTVVVFQFVMTILGLGLDSIEFSGDVSQDVGGDIPHDVGGDMPADMAIDAHHGAADAHHVHAADGAHGSTWLFGILSFRTVVAAIAFFGLGGLAAMSAELSFVPTLLIALASGSVAMLAVHQLMRALFRLSDDGTVRIERAVGKSGTVYLSIPGSRQGTGKIHLKLQHRLLEYQAVTSAGEKLPVGATVVVVGVVGPSTLEVEPAPAAAKAGQP
jgi:membrane protein implicated in regulation of membrane protease activity